MKNTIAGSANSPAEIDSDMNLKDYQPLDSEAIKLHILGKTFLGSFPPFFKYIIAVNADGTLEGKNNYQHYDTGKWIIDAKKNTLSVSWDFGWVSSTSHVCLSDNVVKMFDSISGKLNTSFDELIEDVESIKEFDI